MISKACVTEVTVSTAARILRVSHDTVARLCESGTLKARRITNHGWWRIDYDSLIEYDSSRK